MPVNDNEQIYETAVSQKLPVFLCFPSKCWPRPLWLSPCRCQCTQATNWTLSCAVASVFHQTSPHFFFPIYFPIVLCGPVVSTSPPSGDAMSSSHLLSRCSSQLHFLLLSRSNTGSWSVSLTTLLAILSSHAVHGCLRSFASICWLKLAVSLSLSSWQKWKLRDVYLLDDDVYLVGGPRITRAHICKCHMPREDVTRREVWRRLGATDKRQSDWVSTWTADQTNTRCR